MLISNGVVIGSMVAGIAVPFVITWRKSSYRKIVLTTWISILAASAFIDFAIPKIAELVGESPLYHPPNVPITPVIALTGWLYGLILAGVIRAIRKFTDNGTSQ
jgi:prepilin signal peptidase PulO-like enzyme (type II secretory pathway)